MAYQLKSVALPRFSDFLQPQKGLKGKKMLKRTKRDMLVESEIKSLKEKKKAIDQVIQDITNHLSSVGVGRRIRPCDIDDPDEKECPWNIK